MERKKTLAETLRRLPTYTHNFWQRDTDDTTIMTKIDALSVEQFKSLAQHMDTLFFYSEIEEISLTPAIRDLTSDQETLKQNMWKMLGLTPNVQGGGEGGPKRWEPPQRSKWRDKRAAKETATGPPQREAAFECGDKTFYRASANDPENPNDNKGTCTTIHRLYSEQSGGPVESPYVYRVPKTGKVPGACPQPESVATLYAQACDIYREQDPALCITCQTGDEPTYILKRLEAITWERKDIEANAKACKNALKAFHALGYIHGDPNLNNFMRIPGTDKVVLIDLDTSFKVDGAAERAAEEGKIKGGKQRLRAQNRVSNLVERRHFNALLAVAQRMRQKKVR